MTRLRTTLLLAGLALLIGGLVFAQRYRHRPDRSNFPTWPLDPELPADCFTFARIKYDSGGRTWYGWDRWAIDYPDAEWNLAFRLQQLTSMKVHPEGKVVELTDKELFDHPFIYIVEPGYMILADEEVAALRRYLLNGGFLMVDDFWGKNEWDNFYREIRRVFPEDKYDPVELEMDHGIFNAVFPLKMTKNQLQIPNIRRGADSRWDGITYERWDAKEVHIKGIFDDNGRLMAVICHNTDNGDGWEREGEDEYYFREFSEKKAYPLAINILFYTMTH
jgi:hypothetical protein